MAEDTNISWAHHSFSPWIGCTKVSPGCKNCYAETLDKRFHYTSEGWGKGKPRYRTSEAYWKKPLKWNEEAKRLGARYRVFPSLCDPFDMEVPEDWMVDFGVLVRQTPYLDWLLLTKRPDDILNFTHYTEWTSHIFDDLVIDLPTNVGLGISTENQDAYDDCMDMFAFWFPYCQTNFISIEPMLEQINLDLDSIASNYADWVIVGGESGPNRRPFEVEWAIDIYNQCKAAGIPFFMKQDSALKPGQQGRIPNWLWKIKQIPE